MVCLPLGKLGDKTVQARAKALTLEDAWIETTNQQTTPQAKEKGKRKPLPQAYIYKIHTN